MKYIKVENPNLIKQANPCSKLDYDISKKSINKYKTYFSHFEAKSSKSQFGYKLDNLHCVKNTESKRIAQAQRYVKKWLKNRGIKRANIFTTYETLGKIAEKLESSRSIGSDQNHCVQETGISELASPLFETKSNDSSIVGDSSSSNTELSELD